MKNTSIAVMELWQRKVMKLYWTTSKRNHMTVTPIKSAADTIRFLHNNKSATANWIPNLSESWQGHYNRIKYANSRNVNHWKLTNVTEHKYLTSYTICRVFVGFRNRVYMDAAVPFSPPRASCTDLPRRNPFADCSVSFSESDEWWLAMVILEVILCVLLVFF